MARLQDSRHVRYSSSGDLQVRVGAMGDVDIKRRSAYGVPDAFDASCHYFHMLTELNLHRTVDPFQAFFGALTEPGREVNVRSAVLVFSDPLLFPTPEEIHSFGSSGMSIVLGVKPKMRITQGQLDVLANILLMPEVAALGELGVGQVALARKENKSTMIMGEIRASLKKSEKKVAMLNNLLLLKCEDDAYEEQTRSEGRLDTLDLTEMRTSRV